MIVVSTEAVVGTAVGSNPEVVVQVQYVGQQTFGRALSQLQISHLRTLDELLPGYLLPRPIHAQHPGKPLANPLFYLWGMKADSRVNSNATFVMSPQCSRRDKEQFCAQNLPIWAFRGCRVYDDDS